jgi:hypothetical protein
LFLFITLSIFASISFTLPALYMPRPAFSNVAFALAASPLSLVFACSSLVFSSSSLVYLFIKNSACFCSVFVCLST